MSAQPPASQAHNEKLLYACRSSSADEEAPAAPLPARPRKRLAARAAAPSDTAAVETGMQASEAIDAGVQAGAAPEPPAPEQAPSPSPSPSEADRAAMELRARAGGAEADLASLRRVLAAERGAAEARQGPLHYIELVPG